MELYSTQRVQVLLDSGATTSVISFDLARVRLCVREGVVKLPDEESLLLVGGPEFESLGMELSVWHDRANPEFLEFWTGREETWAARFIYGVNRRPKAVKVVNVSNSIATVYQNTVVAHVMEKGYLPSGERFVRPSSRKYNEWRTRIYEVEPALVLREAEEEGKLWKSLKLCPS
ncbi:hypothetical protein PHMEG_0001888 [Phytophthora megakarya]|uniref:Peptidase A2 domain-containing protein n=1 Tax=Phytophthora megakarya TaxID=4795 RepID=A0A225X1Z8_9STRA|nr:hypothetical protein PHMEG_0001888 [Phytophthora megakarya]